MARVIRWYYTGTGRRPENSIAEASVTGHGTNVIQGLAVSLESTALPALVIIAGIIVTNPTHYAVALKYDPVTMQAPMVIAKGEALLAQRIKEVGRKAGVPVLEEPPLARALFAAVPVGQYIPANLFHAVAEVLAWVYALKTKIPFAGRRVPLAPVGGDA